MGGLLNRTAPPPDGTRGPDAGPVPDLGGAEGLAALLRARGERLDDYTRVQVSPGRNTVVALCRPGGSGVLVKQHRPRTDDRYGIERLLHEEVLALAAPRGGPVHVPRLLGCRPGDRVLEFELVPDAVPLADRIGEAFGGTTDADGAGPVERFGEVLAELGRFTGAFHAATARPGLLPDRLRDALPAACADTERAQFPGYAGISPEEYAAYSPAELRLARLVQGDAALSEALARLPGTLRPGCLLHGDLRAENVLLPGGSGPGGGRRATRAALVDWELARFGDPALELGYFVGNLLHRVLYAVRAPRPDVDAWQGAADRAVDGVLPLVHRFWAGYRDTAGDPAVGRPLLPVLVTAHSGAALLARVAADLRTAREASPRDLLVAARARRLLVHPAKSTAPLLTPKKPNPPD